MVSKGNHSKMALFQVSELLSFAQKSSNHSFHEGDVHQLSYRSGGPYIVSLCCLVPTGYL